MARNPFAGTSGGGHGGAGVGSANRISSRLRRSARRGTALALPALLATGLLRFTPEFYQLPKGFYGIESIFPVTGLDGAGAHPVSGTTAL